MFTRGNNFVGDMVFFAMILMDFDTEKAMILSCTYITTEHAPEPLSVLPLDLLRH